MQTLTPYEKIKLAELTPQTSALDTVIIVQSLFHGGYQRGCAILENVKEHLLAEIACEKHNLTRME